LSYALKNIFELISLLIPKNVPITNDSLCKILQVNSVPRDDAEKVLCLLHFAFIYFDLKLLCHMKFELWTTRRREEVRAHHHI
jgi:hypothetical protein